ncbi:MAG TPA: DUF4382 domain-containing protein [Steroidobacteraceae bacterium]|nr:DUF4382 domain-containing protein [Steroidobacteraceae bacterium]
MNQHIRTGILLACALALPACGGSGGGSEDATGRLNLRIGDAPVDGASEVVIVFTGLELHSEGSTRSIVFAEPREIDLLAYQDGATVNLVEGLEVDAGEYEWLRLNVLAEQNQSDGSYILFESGEQYPLYIPSGAQTGLKINRPFRVAAGGITRLVADFDLRKSIIAPPGLSPNYLLKPVLRLLDELEIGDIEGEVDLAALAAEQLGAGSTAADCDGGIYLFGGADATPDDMDGDATDGADPILFKPLVTDGVETTAAYRFDFVEAGSYTVAATCDFGVDESPEESEYDPGAASGEPGFETMHWTVAGDVIVAPDGTTTVDLP